MKAKSALVKSWKLAKLLARLTRRICSVSEPQMKDEKLQKALQLLRMLARAAVPMETSSSSKAFATSYIHNMPDKPAVTSQITSERRGIFKQARRIHRNQGTKILLIMSQNNKCWALNTSDDQLWLETCKMILKGKKSRLTSPAQLSVTDYRPVRAQDSSQGAGSPQ